MISFPLVGNERIAEAVTNSLKEKRLPHAIIIEGDKGTGRHLLASYIAEAVVCDGEEAPCGICRCCKMAESLNHPDITFTAPEENKKNISVAQIRALKADTVIKPHMAKSRVFIIDGADSMNDQSQNALLKVLEEPPGATYFILIAESKAALLETIISRCVLLTLSNPEKEIAKSYILKNTEFSQTDIDDALFEVQNNIGKALKLLNGESNTEISLAADEFLACMLSDDAWGMMCAVTVAEKNRIEAEKFFKELKYKTEQNLRKNIGSYKSKLMFELYNELTELQKSLATNINLNLLFCTLISIAEKIVNG